MAVEHVTQGSCRFPIPGGIQDQVEWDLKQIDLVDYNPVHGRDIF